MNGKLAGRSAKNTFGCLIGCAIGDLGAIFCFQSYFEPDGIPRDLWGLVWVVAMASGIVTSIILETFILWKQLGQRSVSDCHRYESYLHDFNGICDESGRLWNDGGACHYFGNSSIYTRCRFSCGLAI